MDQFTELTNYVVQFDDNLDDDFSNSLAKNTSIKTVSFYVDDDVPTPKGLVALIDGLRTNTSVDLLVVTVVCQLSNIERHELILDIVGDILLNNKSITTLYLHNLMINDDGAKLLAELFSRNNTLTNVSFDCSNIGVDGIECLAKTLADNTTLTTLSLNGIQNDCIKYIADSLKTNRSLQYLSLNGKTLTGDELVHLMNSLKVNTSLSSISFSINMDIDGGMKGFNNELVSMIKTNKTLRSVGVCGNYTKKEHNDGDLMMKQLYDGDVFTHNDTLRNIAFNNINMTDVGLKYLCLALQQNKTIHHLDICWNNIGDAGCEHLGDLLKTNKSITDIEISYNKIGAKGGKYIADSIEHNTTVTYIDIYENYVDNDDHIIDMIEGYTKRNRKQKKLTKANNM